MKSPLLQLIIALAVCAVAILGYGAWYGAIADKSTIAANVERDIETKTETGGRIASARATLAEIANDEALVQSYFVSETGVVAFINDLEARGKAQGAAVSVLSVSSGNVGGRSALTLTVAITGAFSAVMRTMGSIEYAPRDISISALTLTQDTKASWSANVKLVVGSASSSPMKKTP